MIKSYQDLIKLKTFEERLLYLRDTKPVGEETFGSTRYLNQVFYSSDEWKKEIRPKIIVRDKGCDLGLEGYEIHEEPIYIHHINPITEEDILKRSKKLTDPDNLICVRKSTHDMIHYGSDLTLAAGITKERTSNDMCPWKK